MNTNLWRATRFPDRSIENAQRAARILSFVLEAKGPVYYQDIRRELGLSYRQTVRAVGLLCNMEFCRVEVSAHWNGQHYVYPHRVTEF